MADQTLSRRLKTQQAQHLASHYALRCQPSVPASLGRLKVTRKWLITFK